MGWFSFQLMFSININFNDSCWEQNGNVTIVDTPGIGDSIELKKMLEEYIPKAVAFVIIIDVSRAGGLQRDRVWVSCAKTHILKITFHETILLEIILSCISFSFDWNLDLKDSLDDNSL